MARFIDRFTVQFANEDEYEAFADVPVEDREGEWWVEARQNDDGSVTATYESWEDEENG